MNIFDFAIQREEDGIIFYEKLAAETSIPELKTIFTLIAEEERLHCELFQAMKNGEDPVKAGSSVLKKAKSVFRKMLERKDIHDILKGDQDGYKHSIKAEEDCIKFYEDIANKEKKDYVVKLLRIIAEEEKDHLSILENIYEFVEAPRTFLAWGEFSNLKEL